VAEDAGSVLDFIRHGFHHYRALGWPVELALGLGVPVASFLAGLAVVIGLPADYFVRTPERRGFWQSHRALRLTLFVAKNLLGVMMLVVGAVMALPLVPGPGVLFILLGLGFIDFPGKQALVRRLLRQPRVLSSVNKMRSRFGKPPILTEDPVVNSGS
jgi:hypothetical protein